MNINVLCVRAILQSFTLSFINTYNVQIYIIRADAGTPLSMNVCIVFWGGFFCVAPLPQTRLSTDTPSGSPQQLWPVSGE